MTSASIDRLLLVEDDPGFARLLREMFKDHGSPETVVTHVESMAEAERSLAAAAFDIVLLDPGLPDCHGIDSVRRVHAAAPRVPLVVLTGRDDESLALEALQAGAQDYLIKGQIDTRGLLRFLRYGVERHAMEDALVVEKERNLVAFDRLRVVSAELERSNRELQDFATIASHDLQEPLRKIRAFGDRLTDQTAETLDETASDYLRRMTNAAGRMQILIQDLLAYSQVTLNPEPARPVDLERVVADVLTDLEDRIRVTSGRIEVGQLPIVDGNPSQLRQLFQNLIANGLKFHAEGVVPEITVSAEARNRLRGEAGRGAIWEIRIKDNGIGFDDKHAERIFAPFQRLHGRQAYEGTGMGLAICRRIAAQHGGTVTAHATLGAGATFVVSLPRNGADDALATDPGPIPTEADVISPAA